MQPDYSPESARGRCSGCGFLAKWAHDAPSFGFFEVAYPERLEGKAYRHQLVFQGPIVTMPTCLRGAVQFESEDELGSAKGMALAELERMTLDAFNKDRHCTKWYPYRPGLSPQQHLAELQVLELEQHREEFEQEMEQERRAFEERMENERRGFEETLAKRTEKSEERRHYLLFLVAVAALILALAEVSAAILGAGSDSLVGKLLGLD